MQSQTRGVNVNFNVNFNGDFKGDVSGDFDVDFNESFNRDINGNISRGFNGDVNSDFKRYLNFVTDRCIIKYKHRNAQFEIASFHPIRNGDIIIPKLIQLDVDCNTHFNQSVAEVDV